MDGVAHADLQANNCHHWRKQLVTAIVNIFHSSFTPQKTQNFRAKTRILSKPEIRSFSSEKSKKKNRLCQVFFDRQFEFTFYL
jgi:hypothetical protein